MTRNWQPCRICQGLGIIFRPSGNSRLIKVLDLCDCVLQHCSSCPGDKKPPYYYYDADHNKLMACPCRPARLRYEKTLQLLQQSKIPKKFLYRRLVDFETKSDSEIEEQYRLVALDEARQTIEQFQHQEGERRGLYIFGPPGTGKTLLGCIILNELAMRYLLPVRYVKITRDFFNRIRNTFISESQEYGQAESIFRELAEVEVLLLDDFGVQADSAWEQRTLYDLIDIRYENEKATIITSNTSLSEAGKDLVGTTLNAGLVSMYQRIISRLREMTTEVKLITTDYREKREFG
ncbi:MAG: ATP-binding protein [Leptospiraceae bacterium]|nr:ATP-binding protein [Leptospiraceae bacterium]MDW8305564.1 ATP-binding protein [Leptospiraceae bacterium]